MWSLHRGATGHSQQGKGVATMLQFIAQITEQILFMTLYVIVLIVRKGTDLHQWEQAAKIAAKVGGASPALTMVAVLLATRTVTTKKGRKRLRKKARRLL